MSVSLANAELMDHLSEIENSFDEPSEITTEDLPSITAPQQAFNQEDISETIKHYDFDADSTYKISLRQFMPSIIHLPKEEVIISYSYGLKHLLKVTPVGNDAKNILNLYTEAENFDTSLSIYTQSGNIYVFYIKAENTTSGTIPNLAIYIDNAPIAITSSEPYKTTGTDDDVDYLKTLGPPSKLNTNYKIYGDAEIAPYSVYDDGTWTYFDFKDNLHNGRQPVLYKIIDGVAAIINFRFEHNVLIAESLSKEGWQLINGDKSVCIKNGGDKK